MGFYAMRWWRWERQGGLVTAQICIMWEACYSCLDTTAWLGRPEIEDPKSWLGDKTRLSLRSLERHLPQLAKLELLVPGEGGFRLPRFYEFHRQNGGRDRQIDRQFVRQNGGALKEGLFEIVKDSPPTPSRARGKPSELHTFTVARCEVCLVAHDWEVREPYIDTSVRLLACPDWRQKLRAAEVKA